MTEENLYIPPDKDHWKGRKDSLPNERFFQQIITVDMNSQPLLNSADKVLIGFCSDEGIRRNQGRLGAKEGPNALRTELGKLASQDSIKLFDLGNVVSPENKLEEAQQLFSNMVKKSQLAGHRTIGLGGGHEIAWAHYLGLVKSYTHIGIINFDAHFDIRPTLNGLSTSGSSFWQMQQHCEQNDQPFEYCCLGIQPTANTQSLFKQADDWNIHYLTAAKMQARPLEAQIAFLDQFIAKQPFIYLSICLDVFAEAYAPGVSAPQALGLNPNYSLPLLKYIIQTGKVVGLDIAELSPPQDREQKTARLAANILAELINF